MRLNIIWLRIIDSIQKVPNLFKIQLDMETQTEHYLKESSFELIRVDRVNIVSHPT